MLKNILTSHWALAPPSVPASEQSHDFAPSLYLTDKEKEDFSQKSEDFPF